MATFNGDSSDNTINGTQSADTIYGNGGNDTLDGHGGDDTIHGGSGNDKIYGGSGNDRLYGDDGADDIYGESGNDVIYGGEDDDAIYGGDGVDTIYGDGGNDFIDGGADTDTINGGEGNDTISGGDGNDVLYGDGGSDVINGDGGNDTLYGGEGDDTITGGDGADTIYGDNGNDIIDAGAGNDTVYGGAGNDTITAGDGYDNIYGGDGNDIIYGGGENDYLRGENDADTFIINTLGATTSYNVTVDGGSGGVDDDKLDLRWLIQNGFDVTHQVLNPENNGQAGFNGQVTLTHAVSGEQVNVNFHDIEKLVICFTPGTAIATPKGELPVEMLRVGDKVFTRDNGAQEIKWVGRRNLSARELERQKSLMPVLIEKGALGDGLPERDLMVSPQHRILLTSERAALFFDESEVITPAKHLVGLPGISRVKPLETSYIHFLCDNHEIVLSNGSWSESFQPGANSIGGLQDDARDELFRLFPELATQSGLKGYGAARRSLKKHETQILVSA
ncbi:Hint domain-containing protein [Celeribacter arenosi]|uniref:Hedgehog/Intein (Hint) domain-containing protein n=1 Tax=Celeribacter arenosi TaxID=792649 RepID=A0ABP7KHZ7_9RHOB